MSKALPIIPITLPTPWPSLGTVNTYLIREDPVTLIDTGLYYPESREALLQGLRAAGVELSDVRRVLLTHAHMDHCGQAGWIQEAAGATVYLHPDEAGKVQTPEWWRTGRDQSLREAGAAPEKLQKIDEVWRASQRMVAPLAEWEPIPEDGRFAFEDGELKAVHLPGHALGHTGFWDAESRSLFGGDHLIEGVIPNPMMEPLPPGHPAAAPHAPHRALALKQFLASLQRVSDLPVDRVLPGHGPVITDHVAVADFYLGKNKKRLDMLLERIQAGQTVEDVSRQLHPYVKGMNIFLALSEVLAHLDLLVARGRATIESHEGGWIYQAI